jgi:transposase
LVHSKKAAERENKTFDKKIEKELKKAQQQVSRLKSKNFESEKDALQVGVDAMKRFKYQKINWNLELIEKHASRGRPKSNTEKIVKVVANDCQRRRSNRSHLTQKRTIYLAFNELKEENLPYLTWPLQPRTALLRYKLKN